MVRPTLIDLTRLATRSHHPTPSGIDRVDLAYARHVLGMGDHCFGVINTPFGPRLLERKQALRLVDWFALRWEEPCDADPQFRELAARLGLAAEPSGAPPFGTARNRGPGRARMAARFVRMQALRLAEFLPPTNAAQAPEGAIYLHTSHLRLEHPRRFAWLSGRPDVRAAFFVHDLIPIEFPEYCRAGEARRHCARMATVKRAASTVIVSSEVVRAAFASHPGAGPRAELPVTIAPIGIEEAFLRGAARTGRRSGSRPYFVTCGTIEPRKNHLLLLQIWRDLVQRDRAAAPMLVIVGRRGWDNEMVVDLLDRCETIRDHVIEVPALSTPALAAVLAEACAALLPSFAEGYGIPLPEALALGTPVVASDIAVHREVAGEHALLLDPSDGPAWRDIIRDLSVPGSRMDADLRRRAARYRAPTWREHFALVDGLLAEL